MSSVAIGLRQVKAGKLKVLAVTSRERLPHLPNDPTVKESGIDGFVGTGWLALMASAKTPAPIVKRYNEELNRVLNKPDMKARIGGMGATPLPGPPGVLDKTLREESAMWDKVIRHLAAKGIEGHGKRSE